MDCLVHIFSTKNHFIICFHTYTQAYLTPSVYYNSTKTGYALANYFLEFVTNFEKCTPAMPEIWMKLWSTIALFFGYDAELEIIIIIVTDKVQN